MIMDVQDKFSLLQRRESFDELIGEEEEGKRSCTSVQEKAKMKETHQRRFFGEADYL